jgi:hypothetical protein
MDTPSPVLDFRQAGIALLATVVIFMIGAWSAAYFRRWPLPADPLEKLTIIANDRLGWTAQAVLFPIAFLATAVIFGGIAARLPGPWPRWLAIGATMLFGAGGLLWLPISIYRLQLGAQAAAMIRTYDPAAPPPVMVNSTFFWPHTICILAAITLMGATLALTGTLPILGWIITALGVLAALIGALVWHDWPPFMSYLILLALAIGLIRAS